MKQETKSTVYIVLAGIFWGLIAVFVRKLSSFGLDSMEMVLIKMLVGVVGFGLYLVLTSPSAFKIEIKDIWMFVGTGLFCIFSTTLHTFMQLCTETHLLQQYLFIHLLFL